jgi:hypothetical protein
MSDTMYKLQKLERERHKLYKMASHNQLNPGERERISDITSQLQVLWDQHRREDAAARWGAASMSKGKKSA